MQNLVADAGTLGKWSKGMFALGAVGSIMGAMNEHKQGKQQAERIGNELAESYLVDKNKLAINELRLRNSIEDIQREFAKDASRAKTNAIRQADQQALQVTLDQKVRYGQALAKVDAIEESLPNGFDVAMQIGMQAITSYATFGVAPF